MSEGGPSAAPSTLVWGEGRLGPRAAPTGELLAADSWLVVDGSVLAFELHVDRILRSVRARGGDADTTERVMRAVPKHVPTAGRWFPRVDVRHEGIAVHVRPAPPIARRAVVTTAAHDPRRVPTVKGPDLEDSLLLRAEAEAMGANEAVIVADGAIADGTTSAVLWWRGETLVGPTDDIDRVDSVTARAVLGIAAALGVEVDQEHASPASLDGCEAWVLSALHGVRGIDRWLDGPRLARPLRADAWHARLEALRRPWT